VWLALETGSSNQTSVPITRVGATVAEPGSPEFATERPTTSLEISKETLIKSREQRALDWDRVRHRQMRGIAGL
jgi:hypothetical protein